ncbi:MAG TPA: hypothetical protein VD970_18155, partial [Acetobacteraceae bacterium]|nr:hypothetical protein [Acetobacteraceae bacterium]
GEGWGGGAYHPRHAPDRHAMIRASLLIMVVLTVVIFIGLRWREERLGSTLRFHPLNIVGRTKHTANRWVTAAALAVLTTLVVMGGLHWLRMWTQS